MTDREEFEIQQEVELYDWCAENNGNISVGDAWHEAASRQQKKIDALEKDLSVNIKSCEKLSDLYEKALAEIRELGAGNPLVDCPEHCEEGWHDTHDPIFGVIPCDTCKDGKVPLTKAQEYRIKTLESEIAGLEELLQLHRENDKIAGAME